MPKLIFHKGVPRFRKSYKNLASGIKVTKIDRKTNEKKAELLMRKNGTSRFTQYVNGHAAYRVDMQPNKRDYFVAKKQPNGTTKYIKTKEFNMLNTFIEWCVRVFDEAGNEIQQIIKVQGINKPGVNKVIPKKNNFRR